MTLKQFLESRAGLVLLVFLGLLLFSAAVVFCAIKIPQNERIYLFLTAIASNFSGALFTILHVNANQGKGKDKDQE